MSAPAKADTSRWPNTGFVWHGKLDHVIEVFERTSLRRAAKEVLRSQAGLWRSYVARVLLRLADKPAAIKELNKGRNHETAPQRIRGLNVVVHYLAATELHKIKDRRFIKKLGDSTVRQYVAACWLVKGAESGTIARDTLKELIARYRKPAQRELNLLIELRVSGLDRVELLRRINADMWVRRHFDWLRFPLRLPS